MEQHPTTRETKESGGEGKKLHGKTVAILATDGVEQVELTEPRNALERAGAKTVLVSPKAGKIQAFRHFDRGETLDVDLQIEQADPKAFDALLLPGGALNPDQLRMVPEVVEFVRAFAVSGKPIGAICHAAWTLVEADVVRGKTMTSWPSLRKDLENAGATWVDREVVVDKGWVTSRKPADIPAFVGKLIEEMTEPQHARAH
ncbi:MAG TPA: type 1 glutamine amidotransferase domain-containing protein [Polyangiaceae bacterium]|nr:type 1 glutamine amidotransferase domain-containing protein [Polyangiaceae bacterium]